MDTFNLVLVIFMPVAIDHADKQNNFELKELRMSLTNTNDLEVHLGRIEIEKYIKDRQEKSNALLEILAPITKAELYIFDFVSDFRNLLILAFMTYEILVCQG